MSNEELVSKIKSGVDVSENMLKLWEQNKRFIHLTAMHYHGQVDIEDLEQEGYLALCDAVEGYQPEKGYKFLTYAAYWLKKRMKRYIDDCCHTVRIPANEYIRMDKYRKMVNAFMVYLGRMPNRWEIAYNLRLDDAQMKSLESALNMKQISSLDNSLQDGEEGGTIGDMVSCGTDMERDIMDRIEGEELSALLWGMVDELPGAIPQIVHLKYQNGKTVKEIGEYLGIPKQIASRMERKAMTELRKPHNRDRIRAFLPERIEAEAYRHNGIKEFNNTWTSSTERAALKLNGVY